MKDMIIEYVDGGLGNRFEQDGKTIIELNRDLLKYPELHRAIIRHEMGHTKKSFSYNDLRLDLTESKVSSWKILKFMVSHPKSFTQLLPIYYTKKYGLVYDLNLILIYSVCLVTFCITLFFALKI